MKTSKMTHQNDEDVLMSFFDRQCIYEIPIYQRNYKWGNKKINQVLTDFDEILDDQKEVHFFGAMIFYQVPSTGNKPTTNEVIDGQQRITTIYLFLLAYAYVLRKYDLENARDFFLTKLTRIGLKTENSTLRPSKEDRGQLNWIFGQIIKPKNFSDILGNDTYRAFPTDPDSSEKGALKINFSQFRKYLESKIKKVSEENKGKVLTEIVYKILNACTAVSINIIERANGPLIFDALNARQEPITVGQLIKNAIFARNENVTIEEMNYLHSNHWFPFQEKFKLTKNVNLLEGYFFPFTLIKSPNIKKNEVYDSIVSAWDKSSTSEQIIDNLREYQDSFLAINGGSVEMYSKEVSLSIKRLVDAGIPRSCMPFFMQLLNKVEQNPRYEDEALKILDAMESFLVRRALCINEVSGLHAIFKRMWQDLGNREDIEEINSKNVMDYIIAAKTVNIPSNNEFEKQIKENPLYKKKNLCRFMLLEYDKSLGGEFPTDKDFTIEHVMPQSLKNWSEDFNTDEHKLYLDTFANLVLLTGKSNNLLGDKSYKDKRNRILGNAKFKSTRKLFENNSSWQPVDINKRASMLSDWAINRWSLSQYF